ncbi:MAG: hypothetical protein IK079_04090 [Desulfovibrio sp.]|nr:hypothetical protein [Desulfovibrio sp.]
MFARRLVTAYALFVAFFLCSCAPFIKTEQPFVGERIVALMLPLSGPYGLVAAKITQGARAAGQELQKRGVNVRVIVFNTNSKDWLQRLEKMPPHNVVIGGPLEPQAYNQAKARHLFDKRVCFAFLNKLDKQDEGRIAYRFFPSQQDQIDALVDFATEKMRIRSFGAFYPTDEYGLKMVALLEKTLADKHIPLQKASYTPGVSSNWPNQVKPLINPRPSEFGSSASVIPQTSFEAVFLPDSWRYMDKLITSFWMNGEDRLIMMGTMAWEQSLQGKHLMRPDRYELGIFPSAWKNQAALPGLKENSYWHWLGYDFVHFAVQMGLTEKPDRAEVISRANRSIKVFKGLAPIYWDNVGIAHQKLFIYRVTGSGYALMDTSFFTKLRDKCREQAALRMQNGGKIDLREPVVERPSRPRMTSSSYESRTIAPKELPKVEPQSQSVSTIPQSSHKLRLPTNVAK